MRPHFPHNLPYTWGSRLQYHPYLHLVIPCGALSKNKINGCPHDRSSLFTPNPWPISSKQSSVMP
ncbi:MAG: transposase [Thermodesulfobacteriota bacterium]|nr:transposase [Thermodesulfobacteriota bacterium]